MREPRMIRYERTAYGKAIRKQYEAGEVHEKIGNMRSPMPRPDFIANTLTGVLKDNHLLVPIGWEKENDYINEWTRGELNDMKVNSFFCGAGGFDLGFIQAGFEIVGAYDFDKYAVQSYNHNIGGAEQADVSLIKGQGLKKANGWLFGFPCQDISVAGKQKGMIKGETRSGLFYEIMRLLDEVSDKPEWILAENVKAVNKFIPTIEEEYDRAGYHLVRPQLYNSKLWGVPQNRERFFLLGIRKDLNKSFVFPQQQTDFIPKLSSVLESEVDEKFYIDDLKAAKIIEQAIEGLKVKQATKKGYDIAVEGDSINISHPNSTTRRGRVGKQVAQTLLTGTEQVVVEGLKECHAVITPDRVDKRQNGRRAKPNEEEMFTLTSQDLHGVIQVEPKILTVGNTNPSGRGRNGNVISAEGISTALTTNKGEGHKILTNEYCVRKLTPREYARLQGFPDSYEQVGKSSYLMYNKIEEIGNRSDINCLKNVNLSGVNEKSKPINSVNFVLCTTNEWSDTEVQKFLKEVTNINVNVAIEKLEGLEEQEDYVVDITTVGTCMETLYTLIKNEKNWVHEGTKRKLMVKKGTEWLWRISLEENSLEVRLFIMLTLIKLITELKISTYVKIKANIHFCISNLKVSQENLLNVELSHFKMDATSLMSNSQFYKQMGNAVTVNVSHAIATAIGEQLC